ncbi:MAG: acetyltransferase [Candidatus Wildermuthbacteria bacterium RIFCSPHIGHO2_02_FULL_49_12b]|nr:MAG: acetyltransferase [Candidatus Wildermuthbacteria bacterium RIFCSPHIGHO2_02_FULL_49_12b]
MAGKIRKNKDITIGKKRFPNWKAPEVRERAMNEYHWMVQYKDKFKLGKYTDIGAFTYINAKNGVVLEDGVQVGSHCSIYSYSTVDGLEGKVVLKENCKIGSHSVISPGVTIGKNSIIGAFSFVKDDIPANVVAFGIPAKVMRKLRKEEIS